MISYLGVTIDELVQTFENTFAFSDDRTDRILEEPIEVSEVLDDEDDDENEFSAESLADDQDDEDFEDDDIEDVYVDDEGQLNALGQTVPFAAEAAVAFLTDYIVADDLDEEWLTLDQARGALLALRIILPSLEEIPEVESAYSFSVKRDPLTGLPNFVSMKPLSSETAHAESLHVSSASYDGVINDDTSLVELIENANIAEDDRELLGEVLSEAVFALADEQCGIIFDVKAFCDKIAALAAAHKSADNQDTLVSETKH